MFLHRQRLLAQPVQHGRAVGCLQQFLQGVTPLGAPRAMGQRQQAQVVVAQHRAGAGPQRHQAAQHLGRCRAPVDQIAQQVKGVAAG